MNVSYFDELRKALRHLPSAEVEDIVEEVAVHIDERAETIGQDAAFRAFGDPRDIAHLYLANRMAFAPASPSPWRALRATRLIAGLSAKGLAILIASAAGYGFGLLLVAMATVKPFTPDLIGLWRIGGDDPSFSLGRTHLPQGEELLGWWIIPIGYLLGAATLYFTWRVSLSAVRSLIRTLTQRVRPRTAW